MNAKDEHKKQTHRDLSSDGRDLWKTHRYKQRAAAKGKQKPNQTKQNKTKQNKVLYKQSINQKASGAHLGYNYLSKLAIYPFLLELKERNLMT